MVVPQDNQQNHDELYLQLRNKFFEDLTNPDDYEPDDLERVRNDDHYVKRFLLHKKGRFDDALDMMKEALAWRKTFDTKSCTADSIPPEFFQTKAVYPYNRDKEGFPVILLLVRYHRKNAEFVKDMRRFVIYWVEKMEAESCGDQMTVIMSCVGAGLSNLDLDLIKFLITLFRSYYPHSLAHILIFEMPWIFNAAWKIIKTWLPEDFVEKIVFVNKITITDFVSEENLHTEMGGTCTLEYEYCNGNESDVNSNSIVDTSQETDRKRVHFSHNGYAGSEDRNLVQGALRSPGTHSRDSRSHLLITDDYCILSNMLKISPAQNLIFNAPTKPDETIEVNIKLTSVSSKPITFKVKTNNIDSYRVKPSTGTIAPNESVDITVFLLQGHDPLPSDKFLIMVMELPEGQTSSSFTLSQLWRSTPAEAIADYKLKCVSPKPISQHEKLEEKVDNAIEIIGGTLAKLQQKIDYLESSQRASVNNQRITLGLLTFLGVSIWAHILYSNVHLLSGFF